MHVIETNYRPISFKLCLRMKYEQYMFVLLIVFASEFLDSLLEMFLLYYIDSDVYSQFKSSINRVLTIVKNLVLTLSTTFTAQYLGGSVELRIFVFFLLIILIDSLEKKLHVLPFRDEEF